MISIAPDGCRTREPRSKSRRSLLRCTDEMIGQPSLGIAVDAAHTAFFDPAASRLPETNLECAVAADGVALEGLQIAFAFVDDVESRG